MIVDNFLDSFDDLKKASVLGEFKDEVNPVDCVTYPLICKDIPENVREEALARLAIFLGRPVKNPVMFMRRSPKGVECPHQVHSDNSMGDYSLMLYINGGGTAMVRHKRSGIAYSPSDERYLHIIHNDQNNSDAWVKTDVVVGEPNRAVVFDSYRLHMAMPVGGFGEGVDARVIMTCFFS